MPLTQQQAVDVLEVYDALISEAETEQEACTYAVRRSLECGFISFLAGILTRPFQHVHELDAQVPQPFLPLRMKAAKSLQRLLITSSDLGARMCSYCFRVALEEGLLPQLLHALAESPHEPLRLSAAETLFVFAFRIHEGTTGLVASGGIGALCRALVGDTSPAVRSVCASVLRETVNTHAEEFTVPGTAAVLVRGLDDGSADVRVLASEIIDQALHLCPSKMVNVLQDSRNLFEALQHIFEEDPSVEVVESAARLFETCCSVAAAMNMHSFFALSIPMNVAKTLLQRLRGGGNAGAALARSLRLLVQYTPAQYELPRRILHEHELLAVLLKGIVDAGRGRSTAGEDYATFQIKSVELALCLCIILSQTPAYREHLERELHDYQHWAAVVKNAAFSLLDAAALDYYTNIELQDITGCHLNALREVEWDPDNTPQRGYVHRLFQKQAQRVGEMQEPVAPDYSAPLLPEVDVHDEEQQVKKVRLTFVLLVFAINLTFPVDSQEVVEGTGVVPAADGISGGLRASQPCVANRAVPRFPSSSAPARSKHREYMMNPNGLVNLSTRGRERSAMSEDEKEAMAIAYDKFNSSMALVMKYTQHYSSKRQKADEFVETDDGYIVRTSRLKNPWHVIVENQRLKTWQVNDLKVADLLYFSLPFDEIGVQTMDALVHKVRRHAMYLKKELLLTPQSNKGRRWFIHDMMKNVMPNALALLEQLRTLVQARGGDGVRFPIFLFREKELHFGERALHPGNLVDVVDQIEFYFSQSVEKTVGVDNARLLQLAKQLDDIEKDANMVDLFDSNAPAMQRGADREEAHDQQRQEEDENEGYGHGTISSDSETDL
ncbi:putative casein kinase II, alpha chain [Trypanosoma grayi]|uniref:putative casein kinase II, alpha chain n=1 Tax=Trypanosoma grayi TaxID=71804 RepID=UPI0004F406A8|nr:putative casein kinase II, alpha chain [Trypanosoma grayi]KEG12493.1 putative casein kinase II, alpha chain [Trypanosoma grayi]